MTFEMGLSATLKGVWGKHLIHALKLAEMGRWTDACETFDIERNLICPAKLKP